ncbi:TIGR01459 family HAD-type hydrolase [Variovorax sp. Varisp62]|uniref:TIGR01459 family HAD-type hydrolase n=1 Tax=Variovorax sp. Varisp62 TaxID=3243049 RepID=UPI0039B4C183
MAGDISGLSQLAGDYDTVMCDLWGTLHDGVVLFPDAVAALQRYRAVRRGTVVLLSNSARPCAHIQSHLEAMGLSRDSWDAIVTSGDVCVDFLSARLHIPLFHLGPDRDLVLYDEVERRTGVRPTLCNAESAEMVVCTGTSGREPADFDELLKRLAARNVPMLCANPDLIAPDGAKFVFCAGTLASRYREFGGSVRYTGKPYTPIYVKALAVASSLWSPPKRVLAIGDGLETDIRGAAQQGWDAMRVFYEPRQERRDADSGKGHAPPLLSNKVQGGLVW